MPGRAGRNKHSSPVDLTETNLAAYNAAVPRRKQDLRRWNDHVALPDALKPPKRKNKRVSPPLEAPADEGTWLDRLAWWFVGLAKELPGLGVAWRERIEEDRDEEDGDAAPAKEKRMKGKRWYR